jgi:MFS family permease
MAYFLSEKAIAVFSAKSSLMAGSALNAIYVTVYLFPVSCKNGTTGICNHGFTCFLLILFSVVGGCGASITWSAKIAYLNQCNEPGTERKHRNIFNIVFGFAGILAGLFGLALLGNSDVRIGLYIIMLILSINAALVQLCKLYIEY